MLVFSNKIQKKKKKKKTIIGFRKPNENKCCQNTV